MADNLRIDEGTGKYVATDEISTDVHVSKVKLLDATTDSTYGLVVDSAGHAQVDEQNSSAILTAVQLIDDAVYADDADWTDSTSKHLLVGGLYQSTPQTITDGDVGPLQTDSTGKLLVGNPSIAGTAGTPNAGVLSVQGVTSMTPIEVNSNLAVAKCIQWTNVSNSYSTAQTSTDLVALSGSTKFYIGCVRISTGYVASATTTSVRLYLGTGAWSNTEQTIFAGEFSTIPGSGLVSYPGVVIGNGEAPFCISAAGDALKITTSASTHCVVYVSVDYIRV